jgi:nucleoside-diphosphate-sugar epimerase
MRVLVTGGAGVIGSNLVAALVARGDDVLVLDDLSSGERELVGDAELLVGSVADEAIVAQAFAWQPDAVAHLAALFANQNSVDHPARDLAVNGGGTLTVLDAAHRAATPRVLVCSSSCVYTGDVGADDVPIGRPATTPYAITKALGEDYARYFADHHGLSTVIVRPFNAYGPPERPGPYRNVIPNFFAAAMRREALTITGTGEETRDFTYVSDVAAGMVLALRADVAPGSTYDLASGVETSIGDLAVMINDIAGNGAGVQLVPRRAWDRTARRRTSIERARRELGYEPAVALADGLVKTYESLRETM